MPLPRPMARAIKPPFMSPPPSAAIAGAADRNIADAPTNTALRVLRIWLPSFLWNSKAAHGHSSLSSSPLHGLQPSENFHDQDCFRSPPGSHKSKDQKDGRDSKDLGLVLSQLVSMVLVMFVIAVAGHGQGKIDETEHGEDERLNDADQQTEHVEDHRNEQLGEVGEDAEHQMV